VTAATDSTTPAGPGWAPSGDGAPAARGALPEDRSKADGRRVSTGAAATPPTLANRGRQVVPAPRQPHLQAVSADGSATGSGDTRGHVSQQVAPAGDDASRGSSGHGEPLAAAPGEGGPESPCGLCRLRAERGIPAPPGGCTCQCPTSAAAAGSELSAEARVRALDGAERAVLLDHIARAYPEVVDAGFELVAQWRAECAERRKEAARERKRGQRRRQRAADRHRG
jgi:hypothetical protein